MKVRKSLFFLLLLLQTGRKTSCWGDGIFFETERIVLRLGVFRMCFVIDKSSEKFRMKGNSKSRNHLQSC